MLASRTGAPRCAGCLMFTKVCICEWVPSIETKSKLCLIIQKREFLKPSNTGLLATKCLDNSEVHIRGGLGEPLDYEALVEDQYENLFLFPTKEALPLDADFIRGLSKPVKLFVADGNWGQAIRAHRKCIAATGLRSVCLPVGAPTEYQLRQENERPEGLATMEAIARSFGVIEGEHIEAQLNEVFLIMVKKTLSFRGKIAHSP